MKSKRKGDSLPASVLRLRTELGLNQRDFAAKLGVSAMAVSRWEAGTNEPPGECVVAMAKMSKDPALFWFLLGSLGLTKRDLRR
jgi:DNA-binding transcriptional regulator YiaG